MVIIAINPTYARMAAQMLYGLFKGHKLKMGLSAKLVAQISRFESFQRDLE